MSWPTEDHADMRVGLVEPAEYTFDPPPGTQRRVVAAACMDPNGLIVVSARHYDWLMHKQIEHTPAWVDDGGTRQGFIDQFGNYMSREEAWIVASEAGQILRRCGGDGTKLYSENLY